MRSWSMLLSVAGAAGKACTWNFTRSSQGTPTMGGERSCARKGHLLLASAASSLLVVAPLSGRSAVLATTPAEGRGGGERSDRARQLNGPRCSNCAVAPHTSCMQLCAHTHLACVSCWCRCGQPIVLLCLIWRHVCCCLFLLVCDGGVAVAAWWVLLCVLLSLGERCKTVERKNCDYSWPCALLFWICLR